MHEVHFLEWFNADFPDFDTTEGRAALETRADEIMGELNRYFHPAYMERSDNAQYLAEDIVAIRQAYASRDYNAMGIALEFFKTAVRWI